MNQPSDRSGPARGPDKRAFLKKLGLSPPVTQADIKQAYFARAREAHPDLGGSVEQFVELQQAFQEAMAYAESRGNRLPWLGAQLPAYVAQQRAVELVSGWGGRAVVNELHWLDESLGEDFARLADQLVEIDLSGTPVGDDELAELLAEADGMQGVATLSLRGTAVGDRTVDGLAALRGLRRVDLRGARASRGRLRALSRRAGMQRVDGANPLADWWRGLRKA